MSTAYPPPPPVAVPAASFALPPSLAGTAGPSAAPTAAPTAAPVSAAPVPAVVPVVAVAPAPSERATPKPPSERAIVARKPQLEPELLAWLRANGYAGKSAAVAASLTRRVRGWLPPGWEGLDGPRLWEAGIAAIMEAEDAPATASAWRAFCRYRTGYVAPDRRRVSPGQAPTETLLAVIGGYLRSGPETQAEDRLRALLGATWGLVGVGDLGALQTALGALGPNVVLLRHRSGAGLVALHGEDCAALKQPISLAFRGNRLRLGLEQAWRHSGGGHQSAGLQHPSPGRGAAGASQHRLAEAAAQLLAELTSDAHGGT